MAKRGRPSDYNPEIAETICEGIATGLLLPEVCKRPGMPSPATIFIWLNRFPDFQEQYARAKEIECEILAGGQIAGLQLRRLDAYSSRGL